MEARPKLLDQVNSFTAIITAVLGFLAALTPVFGENGLAGLFPMPEGFTEIGPPFASAISLAAFLAFFVFFIRRPQSKIPWLGAFFSFVAALLLLGAYLSWVDPGQVSSPGGFGFLNSAVVALLVYVFGITSLTSGFAFIGAAFFQREGSTSKSDLGSPVPHSFSAIENTAEAKTGHSLLDLVEMVYRADWDAILQLAPEAKRTGFWKLYDLIARLVTSADFQRNEAVFSRIRAWTRLLSITTKAVPEFMIKDKDFRVYLVDEAWRILRSEIKKRDIRLKLGEPNLAYLDIYVNQMAKIPIILSQPLTYGIAQIYDELHTTILELNNQYQNLTPVNQLSLFHNPIFSLDLLQFSLESTQRAFTGERAKPIDKFRELLTQSMQGFTNGKLETVRKSSIETAAELKTEYQSLPSDSHARLVVQDILIRASLMAAASTAQEINQAQYPKYEKAMQELINLSLEHFQTHSACTLLVELIKTLSPVLTELDRHSSPQKRDDARRIRENLADLTRQAGDWQGRPCKDFLTANPSVLSVLS